MKITYKHLGSTLLYSFFAGVVVTITFIFKLGHDSSHLAAKGCAHMVGLGEESLAKLGGEKEGL